MGCGKLAAGEVLGCTVTYNFLDIDDIIERAEWIKEQDAEAQVQDSVHAYVQCVISTCGGVVMRNMNWSKLQLVILVY